MLIRIVGVSRQGEIEIDNSILRAVGPAETRRKFVLQEIGAFLKSHPEFLIVR